MQILEYQQLLTAKGEIIKKTDYNVKTVLKGNFASNSEITFYSKYGDYIARLAILMTLILSLLSISGRLKNYKFLSIKKIISNHLNNIDTFVPISYHY